jgi:hypothetical protein
MTVQTLHFTLWAFLGILSVVFLWMFFIRFFGLKGRLNRFIAAVRKLKTSSGPPHELAIGDPRLAHLWTQYANTLHLPWSATDPKTGMAPQSKYREPRRICRRLQLLRDRSHDERIKITETFARGA